MKKSLYIDWCLVWLIVLLIFFFLIYSFFSFNYLNKDINSNLIFNSPDETANYYFAYIFTNDSQLKFKDPANEIVDDLVAPRSMRVINKYTVPASFIGFPIIAGGLAKIFGLDIILFITIIFACLAVIFFYFLIKELFNKQIAFIASLLLLINPAWWYYTLKSLIPNILFVSILIISFYFFIKTLKSKNIIFYILFGFFIGLSLIIRTSEVTWLAPLFLILLIYYRKKINWTGIVLSSIICLLIFSPVFYFNYQNYQSIFSFGYAVDLELEGKNIFTQSLNIFEKIFLPFGFHPKTALINLYNYTIRIFPIWSLISLISLIFFIQFVILKKDKERVGYLISFLLISCYLVIYYGSWVFHDNPDPNAITIGNSYIRYWLLLYVFILPMVGYLFFKLFKNSKKLVYFVAVLLFLSLGFISINHIYFGPDEGVYFISNNLMNYEMIQSEVNTKIEDNAIIIADRMDKVFFPRHSVIFRLSSDYDYQRIYKLIETGYPIYYFYFTRDEEQLKKFNERYYQLHQLEVLSSVIDFEEQSLYPVKIKIKK